MEQKVIHAGIEETPVFPHRMAAENNLLRRGTRRIARSLFGTITNVTTSEPVAALTFDDGPDPESTPRLLEIMERRNARGTFFMLGEQAVKHPDLVARAASAGHAVGNHTFDHVSFPHISRRERFDQLRRCSAALGKWKSRIFRPPYGNQDWSSRLDLALARFDVVTWNVVQPDWLGRDGDSIAEGLIEQIHPGCIVLLHDALADALQPEYFNREPTIRAVDLLLQRMSGRFRFVTVPELLRCGSARKVVWSQPGDCAFLKQLKNRAGVARSYPGVCK